MTDPSRAAIETEIQAFWAKVERRVPASLAPSRYDPAYRLPRNLTLLWRGLRDSYPAHAPSLLKAARKAGFAVLPWVMEDGPDLVPWLLEQGLSPNANVSPAFSFLHLNKPALVLATRMARGPDAAHRQAHDAALLALLRAGASLGPREGKTIWHEAALDEGGVARLRGALDLTGRADDAPSHDVTCEGWSPLAYAILFGREDNVNTLLAMGADPALQAGPHMLADLVQKHDDKAGRMRMRLQEALLRSTLTESVRPVPKARL